MRIEERDAVRLTTSTLVELVGLDWVGVLTDISEGGFHCRRYRSSGKLPDGGDEFDFLFVIPTGRVSGRVRLVWSNEETDEMGFEFVSLENESAQIVETYCDSPW